MKLEQPPKPPWSEAPEWAQALGMCEMIQENYFGRWCWLADPRPVGFSRTELRSAETEFTPLLAAPYRHACAASLRLFRNSP